MNNKTRNYIIVGLGLLAVIIVLLLVVKLVSKNKVAPDSIQPATDQSALSTVEFLSAAEQAKLGLPADLKIQILGRDSAGALSVYKIIYSDADIVSNPSAISPISPPRDDAVAPEVRLPD